MIAVMASGFFVALGVGLFSFVLPLMSLDEKISGAWLGSGFAGYYFARIVIGPLAGRWADHTGARIPLLSATAVGAIFPLAYFAVPSIAILYIIQCIMGIVSGLVRPVGMAVIGDNSGDAKVRWFSVHTFLFHAAMFVGPLAGGWLYLGREVQPVLIGTVCCMGVALLILAVLFPKEAVHGPRIGVSKEDCSGCDGDYSLFLLYTAIAGRTFGIGLVAAFYPILLSLTLGRSGLVVGMLFAIPGLAVCLGLPVAGRILGGRSHSVLAFGGLILSAAALYGIGASRELWQFALWGSVMGLGSSVSIPASMTLASRLSPRQGQGFGMAHAASGVGFMAGPLAGGLMVQYAHQLDVVFQLAAFWGLLCSLPFGSQLLGKKLYLGRKVTWAIGLFCALFLFVLGGLHVHAHRKNVADYDSAYRYTGTAMGTIVNLTLVADSRGAADEASRKVMAFMRELQKDLDFRNPRGSVGRINRSAGRNWSTPSKRAYALIRRTIWFSRETGGVFDPTIGALTTSPLYYALDESVALSKKNLVDYRKVQFDEAQRRVRLVKSGMALDLGGIAKGTIIDASVKMLRGLGIAAGIVEAGGDFYCFGDRHWKVGIRHPRKDTVFATIAVREKGVCGSGDYQQFVLLEKDGETDLRHHIINPVDMEPADKVAGVTVVADSAETADSLATALFIMGGTEGMRFVREKYPDVAAMWFKSDMSVTVTENFPSKNP